MEPLSPNVKTYLPKPSSQAALRQITKVRPFSPYLKVQSPEPLGRICFTADT